MEALVMTKCCCRCGLTNRIGSIVIAVLSMIFGFIYLGTALAPALRCGSVDALHILVEDTFAILEKNLSSTLILFVATVTIFFAFILELLCIVLIVGVLKKKKKLILPWLIVNGCQIIAITYYSFVFMTLFPGFMAILWIFCVPFPAYGYAVVLSYYFEIKEEE